MIRSKKITWISLFLVAAALAFTVYAMLTPGFGTSAHRTGEQVYGDAHTVTYGEDDYYSDYAGGGSTKITLRGDTAESAGKNVSVNGGEIIIRGGGTYVLQGTLSDGSIIVDSADSAEVRLVLGGVSVTSSDFSALYVKQAEKVVLSLAEGSENYFMDGSAYNAEKQEEGKPSAAIYSRDDLTINGHGALYVTGQYQDGIKANDGLKVTEGTISVTAADEGINANDYVALGEAYISITAVGDGIKCESESADKGFIVLEETTLQVQNAEDGIYASSAVYIEDAEAVLSVTGDAIHAGGNVSLSPKSIMITKCREGIEGAYITIDGGEFHIVSSDDGINAVGENASGGFGAPMGRQKDNITEKDIFLTINGGTIRIETAGDGVDSNGAAVVNGGKIEVYGPENNGNSSLDFEYGFIINGGSVIACGASGMAELPSETSKQNSLVFYLGETIAQGGTVSITDSAGNVLLSGTSGKRFNWVAASCKEITIGETYTLSINEESVQTVEATGIVTSSGNSGRRGWQW